MLIIGLDIGTSSVKAIAFGDDGTAVCQGRAALASFHDAERGMVEQHPQDWWKAAAAALRQLSVHLKTRVQEVKAIGLTGQCPTFGLLDPSVNSGTHCEQAILYSDNRAEQEATALIKRFGAEAIHARTGQMPSAFYVLPKLLWLQRHQPQRLREGAYVVQPKDFVGWKLTGRLATDPTHAACTLVYDLQQGSWITEWLEMYGLDRFRWPEIIGSQQSLGELTAEAAQTTGMPAGIPVVCGGADSLCAVYGSGSLEEGMLCDISGTSSCLHWLLPKPAADELAINTYPHVVEGQWCAETGINTTGAAMHWLSNSLGQSIEQLIAAAATASPGAGQLLFLPHLAGGERDNPSRLGGFIGLHLGHTSAEMARAVMEGVAFALKRRVNSRLRKGAFDSMLCSGGAGNRLWHQIKADVFGLPVKVSERDTTAWGAAMLAADHLGMELIKHPLLSSSQAVSEVCLPSEALEEIYAARYEAFVKLEEKLE